MAHGLIPDVPFFLLAFSTGLFLWKGHIGEDSLPDYMAPAKPVLKEYLGSPWDGGEVLVEETLQIAFASWLADLAGAVRMPHADSEADAMLVRSGLYDQIRDGEVQSHDHA